MGAHEWRNQKVILLVEDAILFSRDGPFLMLCALEVGNYHLFDFLKLF